MNIQKTSDICWKLEYEKVKFNNCKTSEEEDQLLDDYYYSFSSHSFPQAKFRPRSEFFQKLFSFFDK